MANARHVEIVKELYAAFQKADTSALLRCLTDDVVFTMPEMPGVPLRASYNGKEGVTQFLSDRGPIRYDAFDPQRYFSDQDTVLVLGETAGRVLTTGQAFRYKWVQLFEFAPGDLIQRFHEFLDTNVLVKAFASRGSGGGA
jgi:ketosteroid isomerase-like protein